MAKKRYKEENDETVMDLSPMIDCVFLLLIFFIVVSVQSEVETDPKVKPTIASASDPQTDTIARIVVNVYELEGVITFTNEQKEPIEVAALNRFFAEKVADIQSSRIDTPLTLHLRCDKELAWKHIEKVKGAASANGIAKVNFASYQNGETE